jgi:RNA-binding protein YlmH
MNITVYGAARETINEEYKTATEKLGEEMAKRGHTLIFGGGDTGLMVAVARGVHEGGGKVIGIVPKFFDIDDIDGFLKINEDDNPICLVRLRKDKFTNLSHRDYLGAIMGLGLKREMVGDIKVTDEGADVFCLKSASEFICDNLKKSGRGSVTGEILSVSSFNSADDKFELCFTTVASLRLDGVISAFFNLSRSSAAETVNKGLVYVNSSQCLKCDYTIKEGDKIVLRGKGKTVLTEVKGTSKKGKLKIEYKRYI